MAKKTFRMEDRKVFIEHVRTGDADQVRQFIVDGFPIDAPDSEKNVGLEQAAGYGRKEIVELLIEAGANLNAPGFMGSTALHKAVRKLDGAMVELLLAQGANPRVADEDGNTPAHSWMKFSSFDARNQDYRPVTFEHIEKMLHAGLPIDQCNNKGETLLHLAVSNKDDTNIIGFLLDAGADLRATNANGERAIHLAAMGPRTEILRYLVQERGASIDDPNRYGNTPLHIANWVATIETILELGGNPNAQNNAGLTPFFMMVKNSSGQNADRLFSSYLDAGADLTIPDFQGNTVESMAKKDKLIWFQQFLAATRANKAVGQILKSAKSQP